MKRVTISVLKEEMDRLRGADFLSFKMAHNSKTEFRGNRIIIGGNAFYGVVDVEKGLLAFIGNMEETTYVRLQDYLKKKGEPYRFDFSCFYLCDHEWRLKEGEFLYNGSLYKPLRKISSQKDETFDFVSAHHSILHREKEEEYNRDDFYAAAAKVGADWADVFLMDNITVVIPMARYLAHYYPKHTHEEMYHISISNYLFE